MVTQRPRSSRYGKEFCKRAKEVAKPGLTKNKLAELIGIEPQTLNNWMKKHPEFAEALSAADFKAQKGDSVRYDPAFCQMVQAWGLEGKDIKHVCKNLGVGYGTIQRWRLRNPEFEAAMAVVDPLSKLTSLYNRDYCEKVIEFGKQGKSRTWMAAELGVTKKTIANWMDAHQEFAEAIEVAMLLSQKWWEDKGQEGMFKGGNMFNAAIWAKNMSARFNDWRDKQEITGAGGTPLMPEGATSRDLAVAIFDVLKSSKNAANGSAKSAKVKENGKDTAAATAGAGA